MKQALRLAVWPEMDTIEANGGENLWGIVCTWMYQHCSQFQATCGGLRIG